MALTKSQLIVFDFDWSLVDQDSDRYVFEVLDPALRRKMCDLENKLQWTDIVAQCLKELHAKGITRNEIENALHQLPFHPAMIRGITTLKDAGKTSFFCLSNANSVFITTILEASVILASSLSFCDDYLQNKDLAHIFDEIVTNPAVWQESGLLLLRRRIDANGQQHNCAVGCSPNMCKGDELTTFLARQPAEFQFVAYVGDGANDFCPILRLRSHDTVFVRTGRGLQRRISEEGQKLGLKCKVLYWTDAWELEEFFSKM